MGAWVIVADANLLIYRFVQGTKTELAQQVSARDDDWIVPPLWRDEFSNALAMTVRRAGLTLEQAMSIYSQADSLLSSRERRASMGDALRLSVAHTISVYDAEYVVLAQSKQIRLVTEDTELLRKFPETAVSMSDFVGPEHGKHLVRERGVPYGSPRPRTVAKRNRSGRAAA